MKNKSLSFARSVFVCAGLLACLSSPRPVLAWGRVGHQAVALIAQDRLSQNNPAALGVIQQILGPGVGLNDVAVCADEIKRTPSNCPGVGTIPLSAETKGWHYIDIKYVKGQNPAVLALDAYCKPQSGAHPPDAAQAQKDDNAGNCVVNQIAYWLGVLNRPVDAGNPIDSLDRKTALMFLVHLVGDASQPLHCADDNDVGGNAKIVDFMGSGQNPPQPAAVVDEPTSAVDSHEVAGMNMHHLWDNVVNTDDAEKNASPASLAGDIEKRPAPATGCASTDVVCGVRETYGVAQNAVYDDYYANNPNAGSPQTPYVLGPAYQQKMQPIAYDQIELGGTRLAALLAANVPAAAAPGQAANPAAPRLDLAAIERRISRHATDLEPPAK